MKKTYLIQTSSKVWQGVIDVLVKRKDILPIYWTYWVENKKSTINYQNYPNTIFHPAMDAIRGIGVKGVTIEHPVTQETLMQYAKYERIALKMMDRMDSGGCFLHSDRVRLYHDILEYWLNVISQHPPELVVFPETPHMVYDYVIYSICREKNIETVMMGSIACIGRVKAMYHFETGYTFSTEDIPFLTNRELSNKYKNYLKKIKGDYKDGKPAYMNHWRKEKNKSKQIISVMVLIKYLFDFFILSFARIKNLKNHVRMLLNISNAPANYLKCKRGLITESGMTAREWYKYKARSRNKKQRMQKYYSGYAVLPKKSEKFIFVALHYQPERTTSPEGGCYADQLIMIKNLSALIPDDWHIYVKENPLQFSSKVSHGDRARDTDYYRYLQSIDNISLLPLSTNPFDIIDQSLAVVSVNGTIGWEAIIRNRPAIVFGYAWYASCPGVFYVGTEEELRRSFEIINSGLVIDDVQTENFLMKVLQESSEGYTNGFNQVMCNISAKENIDNYIYELDKLVFKKV